MVYYAEDDTSEVGGPSELIWNSDADDLVYENPPLGPEDDEVSPSLQQDLNMNFEERYQKYPRRIRKWSNVYTENDPKFSEPTRISNSTYDEGKLKHPEIVNEVLMATNEESVKYPDEDQGSNRTYDEDDLKCLEESKALSTVYDDILNRTEQANGMNSNIEEDSLKYPETSPGLTRSLFHEANPEFRMERSSLNRSYVKQPKFLEQTKDHIAEGSSGGRRTTSPQRRQPPAALKTFGAVSRRLFTARSPYTAGQALQAQKEASKWGEENEMGAREAHKRTPDTMLRNLDQVGMNIGKEACAANERGETAPLPLLRRESPVLGQRRARSISTSRSPSLPSALRPAVPSRPQTAQADTPRPSSATSYQGEDTAAMIAQRRNLYLRYCYIPTWVFLAKRHEVLFCKVLDYFFKHTVWPDFQRLPESFRNLCAQYGIETTAKKMPGFAPMWLFALKKMDERYFRATVDYFFEHKAFPHWSWLPQEFVRQFEELGIHERHYFV